MNESIIAEFRDPQRKKDLSLIVGLAREMGASGPALCLARMEKQGYTIDDGFVLFDFLVLAALTMNNSRNQIISALREKGLPEASARDVCTVWNLHVQYCPEVLVQCNDLFGWMGDTGSSASLRSINSDGLAIAPSAQAILAALTQAKVDGAVMRFLQSPVQVLDFSFAREPLEPGALSMPMFAKLRGMVHSVREHAAKGYPGWFLRACLACRGGIAMSSIDTILALGLGTATTRLSVKANLEESALLPLPWQEILPILEAGGSRDDVDAMLARLGGEVGRIKDSLAFPTGATENMGLSIDSLSGFMIAGAINADLAAIESYKSNSGELPPSKSLPQETRAALHAIAGAAATGFALGISLEQALVNAVLCTGANIATVRMLYEGLYAGFSSTSVPKTMIMDARDVLKKDSRSPLLYLRSHVDDAQADTGERKTIEEVIVHWYGEFGPVISLLNPHLLHASTSGTYKLDVEGRDWRKSVVATMLWSKYVVIRANATDHLLWEIDLAMQLVEPRFLVFIFEPRDEAAAPSNNEAVYAIVRNIVEHHTQRTLPREQPKEVVLVFDDDWNPLWHGDPACGDRNAGELVSSALDDSAHHERLQHWEGHRNLLVRIRDGDIHAMSSLAQMAVFDEEESPGKNPQTTQPGRHADSRNQISRLELHAYISVALCEYFHEKYNASDGGPGKDFILTMPAKRRFLFWNIDASTQIIRVICETGAVNITVLEQAGESIVDGLVTDIREFLTMTNKMPTMPRFCIKRYPH